MKKLPTVDISIQYLAGLVDGEGYIGIRRCIKKEKGKKDQLEFKPTLVISNTNYDLMLALKDNFDGSICKKNKTNEKWKLSYAFEFNRKSIRSILPQIIPFLIIKKKQAGLVMALFDTYRQVVPNGGYTKEEIEIKENLHGLLLSLNKRGI